jgi:hypothetical protein
MAMSAALAETLVMVAQAAGEAADGWWLIGSAAVVLHGGEVPNVKDVDLLMSARDAEAFIKRVRAKHGGAETSDRFRSSVFGIWNAPPVPVEVFGGFSVITDSGWRPISMSTREPVTVKGATVYVPAAEELIRHLQSFGRPKDLERATLLRAC